MRKQFEFHTHASPMHEENAKEMGQRPPSFLNNTNTPQENIKELGIKKDHALRFVRDKKSLISKGGDD